MSLHSEAYIRAAQIMIERKPAQMEATLSWPVELLPEENFLIREVPQPISKAERTLDIAIMSMLLLPLLLSLLIGVLWGTPLQPGFLGHSARGLALIFLLIYIGLRLIRRFRELLWWSLPLIILGGWLMLELDTLLLHTVIYWAISQFSVFPHVGSGNSS